MVRPLAGFMVFFLMTVSTASLAVETRFMQGLGDTRATDYTAKSSERDYWGGADKFQQFLSDELLPFIERTYRSRADRRVVFGQSIGGQFVLYTALTRPDLFWGHVDSNPALHRNLPFFLQRPGKAVTDGQGSLLFVGSGSRDDPRFRVRTLDWIEHWSNDADNPWQLKTVTLEGHTHMSAPPASFRQGMAWLFSTDWRNGGPLSKTTSGYADRVSTDNTDQTLR